MLRPAVNLLEEVWRMRRVIWQLACQDLRNRYVGSTLGFVWTFIQPLVFTLILWFVFSMAFRSSAIRGVPFAAWLLAGMVAWNFFAEGLVLSTGVFHEYAYLVKKIQFRFAVLPLVKILSALIVHAIFLVIVMGILLLCHIPISGYWLQTLYYMAGLTLLLLGLSWITSSLSVMLRDVGHLVNILLQFGFWLTPVIWDVRMLLPVPEWVRQALLLNPLCFIVEGYRHSLIEGIPFWRDGLAAGVFWGVTGIVLWIGGAVFRKLKPHLADLL